MRWPSCPEHLSTKAAVGYARKSSRADPWKFPRLSRFHNGRATSHNGRPRQYFADGKMTPAALRYRPQRGHLRRFSRVNHRYFVPNRHQHYRLHSGRGRVCKNEEKSPRRLCAVQALENFPIVQNQSNSRGPWFGKCVSSVPGQANGSDHSANLSDRPMMRKNWTDNGAKS